MTISDHTKESFAALLRETLSPSAPIDSPQYLYGRELQLREIDRALSSAGRQVFIYGDRGVGKTSLAQTAAYAQQSSDSEPVLESCHRASTFLEVVNAISTKLLSADRGTKITNTNTKKIGGFGLEFGKEQTTERDSSANATTFSEAIDLVAHASRQHSTHPLVVLDEFDLLADSQKALFADWIKQIGDRHINLKLILCGIGESLDELLLSHGSCYRYIEGIPVPRLRFDGRLEIIQNSSKLVGVTLGDEQRFRIAAISDGFPHYVHLICEKLYWEIFDDPIEVTSATRAHYLQAIGSATNAIKQELRRSYDKATMKDTDENHFILWAVADHPNLIRRRDDIYESYLRVMKALNEEPLDKKGFGGQLARLKTPGCAAILKSPADRRGYYQFSESIVRGYVRLRAEDEGLELGTEYGERTEPTLTARPKHQNKPVRGWRRMYRQGK